MAGGAEGPFTSGIERPPGACEFGDENLASLRCEQVRPGRDVEQPIVHPFQATQVADGLDRRLDFRAGGAEFATALAQHELPRLLNVAFFSPFVQNQLVPRRLAHSLNSPIQFGHLKLGHAQPARPTSTSSAAWG